MKDKNAEDPNPLATLRTEIERKNAERLAAMTPEERAEELDRIEEDKRNEAAIDAATIPLREYWRLEEDYSYIIDELEERIGDLSQMALDKLQAQETELKAARTRIDALIDANLKAQDIRRQLERLEAKADEVGKIVVEKKAETEKRLAGQTAKANELTRQLRESGAK